MMVCLHFRVVRSLPPQSVFDLAGCYEEVILAFAFFLIGSFSFLRGTTSLLRLYPHLFGPHIDRSETTPGLFVCLTCYEIVREQATTGTMKQLVGQLTYF